MKIAIIEFSKTHYISVITFCNILRKDNNITCFITDDIYKNINKNEFKDINFVVKEQGETFFNFAKKIVRITKHSNYDFILFNSIDKLFIENLYMFVKIHTKKLLTVHNVNTYFSNTISKKASFVIKKLIRKFILKRVDGVNVYSTDIVKYIKETYNYRKPVFMLPFTNHESKWKEKYKDRLDNKLIKIVIPGMVELRRRNYHIVREFLEIISQRGLENKVRIVILGTANDDEGRNMLKSLETYPNAKVYHSFVSNEEFTQEMVSAHFIIGNLNRYINVSGIREEYSITKQSGINANMIQYGLPCICLGDMQCSKELEGMYVRFNELEQYVDYLVKLLSDYEKYYALREKAFGISEQFSINRLRNQFEKIYLNTGELK